MKYKKIVGFGDSWLWGDELFDPSLTGIENPHPIMKENTSYRESNCFLGLLGKHYNVPTENFGIPGGSLQSAMWTYLWWIENEKLDPSECLVLVGHTESNRDTFYNPAHVSYANDPPWNKFIHSAWVHSGASCIESEWSNMVKSNMVLTDCKELGILRYQQSVLFFEGQNYIRSNKIIQFCTIRPRWKIEAKNLPWPDQSLSDFLLLQPNHKQYLAKDGHPNELGHQLIAQHLISHIDSCIINT